MVSGRFNFKINKRFDSLSWSYVVRYLYTMKGYVIGELNEVQDWLGKRKIRRGRLPFPFGFFRFIRLLSVS